MTAKQSLYLRMPVSAFTAENRALIPPEAAISGGYGIMAASRHYTCAEPLAPEGSQNTTAASAHPSESIAYPKDMV